jgi:hypothetical protein
MPVPSLSGKIGDSPIFTKEAQKLALSDFENDIQQQVIDKFMEEHGNDPVLGRSRTSGYSPVEQLAVDYVVQLLAFSASNKRNAEFIEGFNTALDSELGGWEWNPHNPPTGEKGGTQAFGNFMQSRIFNLDTLGVSSNESLPDIPPIQEIFPNQAKEMLTGIEIKTRYANIDKIKPGEEVWEKMSRDFKIHVADMTALTPYEITPESLEQFKNSPEFDEIEKQFQNESTLQKIAIYKIIYKMQQFLFVRTEYKNKRMNILAFILFMRLRIKKLLQTLSKQNPRKGLRVKVTRTDESTEPKITKSGANVGAIFKRKYTIDLIAEDVFSEFEDLTTKYKKELKFIRELYAKEYDFVNAIESNEISARKFYGVIKDAQVRFFAFEVIP